MKLTPKLETHKYNVEPDGVPDERVSSTQPARSMGASPATSTVSKLAAAVLLALILGIGGFVAGMQYQKGKTATSATTAAASRFGGTGAPGATGNGFRGGANRNGSFGTVTAISATSISVQDRRSATAKTYSITSATTITNNGASASASDIAVGDNVIVTTSSATSTTATSIRDNPGFGGPGGAQGSGSGSSDSSGGQSGTAAPISSGIDNQTSDPNAQ